MKSNTSNVDTNCLMEGGYIAKVDGKKHQSNVFYLPEGICPTICAGCGVKYWINVLERITDDED